MYMVSRSNRLYDVDNQQIIKQIGEYLLENEPEIAEQIGLVQSELEKLAG